MKLGKVSVGCLCVCIFGFAMYSLADEENAFTKAIASADRIVVRDGGFDCCRPVAKDKILFVVTNSVEIAMIKSNFRFPENAYQGACMCCGWPGIDWYEGNKRLALTAVQHGVNLRWSGFAPPRKPFQKQARYGDAALTKESQAWLKEWLESHGLKWIETEGRKPKD